MAKTDYKSTDALMRHLRRASRLLEITEFPSQGLLKSNN